jgi:hypothetical protein
MNAKIATAIETAIDRSDPTKGIKDNNAMIGLNKRYQPNIDKNIAQGLIILPAVFMASSCSLNIYSDGLLTSSTKSTTSSKTAAIQQLTHMQI